ncbi:TPA: hypothetical protein ACKWW5_000702 [Neisseria gonorrhoeae]
MRNGTFDKNLNRIGD